MADSYSLAKATEFLDAASLDWHKENNCFTCHTNFAYLYARPYIGSDDAAPLAVRNAAKKMVTSTWVTDGPEYDAEVIAAAAALAYYDAARGVPMADDTEIALKRMLTLQREDGGFPWLDHRLAPLEHDEYYGSAVAAIAIGVAPGDYAKSPAASRSMTNLRGYFKTHPPRSMHDEAMLLWAASYTPDLVSKEEKQRSIAKLLALQLPDGGWSLPSLVGDWKRLDGKKHDLTISDGYGTGFVIVALRRAGVSADNPKIKKGVRWLKSNQRESGRWFTRSVNRDSTHYITNAGSAMAILALAECDALK